MTDLSPTSAFGTAAPQKAHFGGLSLREMSELGLASLALRRGQECPSPFGLTLPGPGGWVEARGTGALWMGPNQWLITGEGAAIGDFSATLQAEVPGASVTEQTDAWLAVEIRARNPDRIELLIEKLVNLPREATQTGRGTRTALHHMSVFVFRPAADILAILVGRSYADSLWHALTAAAERLEETP